MRKIMGQVKSEKLWEQLLEKLENMGKYVDILEKIGKILENIGKDRKQYRTI